jgi:hypothetical protein
LSAFHSITSFASASQQKRAPHVRVGSEADNNKPSRRGVEDVRFTPKSGHGAARRRMSA